MSEKYILCVQCRGEFSDDDIKGWWGCPRCGNQGIPADTRKRGTVTLTNHEWRILCMWAENWAVKICAEKEPNSSAPLTIAAIIREIKRQAPTMLALTLRDESQLVANEFGRVGLHDGGKKSVIEPETKQ